MPASFLFPRGRAAGALIGLATLAALPSFAQEAGVLNLYSARHYATDEALYNGFTKATGIKINRVDADDAGILARLKAEGSASPADVVLLVDGARLVKAEADGLFRPLQSKALNDVIPAHLRAQPQADGGIAWFGLSTRARVIVFNKIKVQKDTVDTYEELGDPKNKGKVCIRSGSHPYNLSLFSAMTTHLGEAKAQDWLKGVQANLARPPKGGDTDQIKAVGAGECGVALVNTYYLARMFKSDKPEDRKAVERIGVVWPNQASYGTHINVSGGGMLKHAPHKEAAVKFLEYLASPEAQGYFANGNNEWPVVAGVKISNRGLDTLGNFKADKLPVGKLADTVVEAQKIFDRAGFR